MRQIRTFEEEYLEVVSSRQSTSSHSRRPSIKRSIFPQCVLDLRRIRTFEEEYLEAVSSHQSASSHSRRLFVEQLIFPQCVLDLRRIRIFEEDYLEAVSNRQSASSHSRRLFVEQAIFPQCVLDLRQIGIFEEEYLEAVSSRRSASSHSRRLFVEQLIFPQCVLGYKTHLLEIYTLHATLTPHFFYLCYSLKPTAQGEWLGYISEGWRNFLLSIDPKPKAVLSRTFSGHRSGPPGEPRGRCGKAAEGSPA